MTEVITKTFRRGNENQVSESVNLTEFGVEDKKKKGEKVKTKHTVS